LFTKNPNLAKFEQKEFSTEPTTKVSEMKKFLVVFLEKPWLDVIAEKKRLILRTNCKKKLLGCLPD
jgi:hypothetical protein